MEKCTFQNRRFFEHLVFFTVPGRNLIVSHLEPVPCETDNTGMKFNNTVAQAELAENWNVSAIICGDGESRLPSGSYFGSTSSD